MLKHFAMQDVSTHYHEPFSLDVEKKLIETKALIGCHNPQALAVLLSSLERITHLVIFENPSLESEFTQALLFLNPEARVKSLPGFDLDPYSGLAPHPSMGARRLGWLYGVQNPQPRQIFTASLAAIMQKTQPLDIFKKNTLSLKASSAIALKNLQALGYHPSALVEDVGQFSHRGNIFDIFSPNYPKPLRFSLFGDIIESIHLFDPTTQRRSEKLDAVTLIPASEALYPGYDITPGFKNFQGLKAEPSLLVEIRRHLSKRHFFPSCEFLLPLFFDELGLVSDYLGCEKNLKIWTLRSQDFSSSWNQNLKDLKEEYSTRPHIPIWTSPEKLYESEISILKKPHINVSKLELEESSHTTFWKSEDLEWFSQNCRTRSHEPGSLKSYILGQLQDWKSKNFLIFVGAGSSYQASNAQFFLKDCDFEATVVKQKCFSWSELAQAQGSQQIHIVSRKCNRSFSIKSERLIFLNAADFFGKQATRTSSRKRLQNESGKHLSFAELNLGDKVVHVLHGIGEFGGLHTMTIAGNPGDFLKIEYKEGDVLYVPIYHLNQVSKYSGPSEHVRLDKLGGTRWGKVKAWAKKKIQDIAADLLKLYANRKITSRPPFDTTTSSYYEFERSFPYTETVDQLTATHDILSDLSKKTPMDRLLCGDTGFGKTEVAMRAAFVAVQNKKQVMLIAPTSVLTLQHLQSFEQRFKNTGVRTVALNRFLTLKEMKKQIEDIKLGKVHIVIGTHRLLSPDIVFKDLGLLIIDEEQKFGVKHKERMRQMKNNLDTLAMSATPIPRTLNMSLVGIRDLSLINTPPIDRLPTRTFLQRYQRSLIKEAIERELSRGGQCFFIHNRVASIEVEALKLQDIVPDARIAVGHGRMSEKSLEKTMIDFYQGHIDVLVCSTIIESGVDVPNANTIMINNAHHMGLSQLYQLRGRVGRSRNRAFCYLLIPQNVELEKVQEERLQVLQENTELGSGIAIARHDMEIRGAGEILGEEQSGHIQAIGYETYMELLEKSIEEQQGRVPKYDIAPEIHVPVPSYIPSSYIQDTKLRLASYKALGDIDNEEQLARWEEKLEDQFGSLPEEVLNLMKMTEVKSILFKLRITHLKARKKALSLTFHDSTPLSPEKIVKLVSEKGLTYRLKGSSLIVKLSEITWPNIEQNLKKLLALC